MRHAYCGVYNKELLTYLLFCLEMCTILVLAFLLVYRLLMYAIGLIMLKQSGHISQSTIVEFSAISLPFSCKKAAHTQYTNATTNNKK